MKRKTSTVPSRVYKYFLLPPVERAEEVEAAFAGARDYYNALIGIELDRRAKYRNMRTRLFPKLAGLEAEEKALVSRLETRRAALNATKATNRSRAVDPTLMADVAQIRAGLKDLRPRIKTMRVAAGENAELVAAGLHFRDEARDGIKALRPSLYWGTYLLCEAAAQAACGSAADPEFNDRPAHLLEARIGVHMCGGIGVDELASSTLMRIDPIPTWHVRPSGKQVARGKAARTMLWFRIGSEGRAPKWARFPLVMDRPLPADARIKDAYITRRPYGARVPWQYSLCIVCESREFERSLPGISQEGTTAINFGWRQMITEELRVAMVNNDVRGLEEIRLPRHYVTGWAKCRELQGLLDEKFDAAKGKLAAWIDAHPKLPERFVAEFAGLLQWKSQHRLAELVWYWTSHRLDGDGDIFPTLAEWLGRYRHLDDWLTNERRKLLDWRRDFYGRQAKHLATTSAKLVIDTFKISDVVRRATPEVREEGGETARRNHQIAAPGELRLAILHAAAKYHCEVVVATAKDDTRRCDVCGEVHNHAIVGLDHQCENPPCGARWDQDANNTDNLHTRESSGEVVSLVRPAETAESSDVQPAVRASFRAARNNLHNLLTTQ